MSKYYYIDTCSLQWRYLNGKPTTTVDSLMDDPANNVLTAELTILEWSSALARAYRRGTVIDHNTFKRNEIALMTDISAGKLQILPPLPRAAEKARYLIEYVGVERKLALGSGDALHLIYAIDAATRIGERLTVITSNAALANIVKSIDLSLDLMHLLPN
jgi:hypothetical protein